MCEHEGRECIYRSCRCECMTCMFGEEDLDDSDLDTGD